jgi:hypothetical protein
MANVLLDCDHLPNLTLLIHTNPVRVAAAIDRLHADHGWPVVSVNRAIADAIGGSSARRGAFAVSERLEAAVATATNMPCLLRDLSLLGDPALGLGMFAFLQRLSRGHTIIAGWEGSYAEDMLSFAVPGHAHYRTWAHPDAQILMLR